MHPRRYSAFKRRHPRFARILDWFPLADLELFRARMERAS